LSCLGVHFALDAADQQRILGAASDDALLVVIQEDIEQRLGNDEFSFQTDEAWDAIHRCLTNGKLEYGPRECGYPLSDEDFEYTWSNFEGLPAFFESAAKAGRPVIYTADQ
jgi:hypothetical protein